MDSLTMTPFGKEMRDKHFLFGKEQVNLNQGAYGSYPRHVRDALRHWQDVAESEPDKFIRYTFPKKLDEIRHQVASFLNADVESTVLVPNATTGLNTVLRNLRFESGDKIVYFRGVYGAIGKTVDYLIETTLVTSLEVDFDPAQDTEESILERFTSSIRGMETSVIDGAHGIGFIDLDLKELDPDFLVTNCHKWLFIPRACAVFYVAPRNQHLMRSSLPTSHGFVPLGVSKHFNPNQSNAQNAFVAQFEYTGTIDTAPILCIPAALEFRSRVCGGEAAIREYCVDLARTGGRAVAEILGTETLPVPTGKHVGFANVRLPLTVQGHTTATEGIPAKDVNAVINFMFRKFTEDYHTFINVLYFSGALWARLCATVYLDVDDFKYGGMVLKKLCQRIESGEYLAQEARDI
ncbi:hypothetical protein NW759_009103 [Fusarium solani]|nr:hypothetical protein NW759_009103 [Fusarium solani]